MPRLHASVIYSHTFDGLSTTFLNGTTVDGGTATWTASATAKANGTDSTNSSLWLPYAFGTGIYTVTATIDVSGLLSNSSGFAGISFTNAAPFSSADFVNSSVGAYSSIGLRGTSNWDFWGGAGNGAAIDGGTATFPRVNTLKLILDTTKTNWEVTASLLDSNGLEVFVDLNPGNASSISYVYATNPATFTGVGVLLRSSVAQVDAFTFSAAIPEPSTYAALVGVASLGLGLLRRRRAMMT